MPQLKEVVEHGDNKSLTVKTQNEEFQFFFETKEEQISFKLVMDMAYNNSMECKNRLARKNYDSLILLHRSNL